MADLSVLRYADEEDRSFGLAGMTIALVLWDGEPFLASLSIDKPVGESMEFTPAFGFCGNPRFSASLAWREMLKQFELSAAMIMGNAMCRAYIGSSQPLSSEAASALRSVISEEARDLCSLEDDEIDMVFNKTRRYLDRAFSHAGVSVIARDFANTLMQRRHLSAVEAFEILASLNHM